MSTALTLYGSQTASTTLPTANTFIANTTGGAVSGISSKVGTSTGYGEMASQGSTAAWPSAGGLNAASGNGVLWDATTLEGQTLLSGNWTPTIRLVASVGSLVADIYIRAYVYNGSTYTQIGSTLLLSAQTITTATTNFTFAATSLPAQQFRAGEKLYVQVNLNITSNSTGSSTATINFAQSTSATLGSVNWSIITPGYQPVSTRSSGLRTIIRSSRTRSASLRTKVRTGRTLTLGLRAPVMSRRSQTTGLRTPVGTRHSWNTSLRLLVRSTPAYITIGGSLVTFDESTFKLSMKLDERWRCQFTVLDYTGTTVFFYGQKVIFYDDSLGTLFSGFVATATQDKSNVYPDPTIEHKIDCIDNRHLADKRSSNRLYSVPTPAGKIVVDMLNDALSAEGVIAHYAVREDMTTAMWAQGTLTNTTATGNALTLTLAGTDFTKTEAVTADFATGTLTLVTAANNALGLTSYKAIKYSGTAGANLDNNNLYAYRKIWAGSAYTLVAGDQIAFDQWIDSRSPEIKIGLTFQFSDGTWMTDYSTDFQDQEVIPLDPKTDLKGWADDQWYSRTCVVPSVRAGKVLVAIYLDIEGEKGGDYIGYFKNIRIMNASNVVQRSIFAITDTAMAANVRASSNGYFNLNATVVTVYEGSGSRVSPSRSITGVGIVKGSVISWAEIDTVQPAGGASSHYPPQVLIEASYDDGATYQTCTNHQPLPGLMVGMNTSGRSIILRQTLSTGGPSPEMAPILDTCSFTVSSAAAATKSDFVDIRATQALLNSGTLTNATSYSDGLKTTGFYKNYDDDATGTIFLLGLSNPAYGVQTNYFFNRSDSLNEVRARIDDAGSWQNFIAELDIHVVTSTGNYGLEYRTTSFVSGNNREAYAAIISSTQLVFRRGSNGGVDTHTDVTVAINLTVGAWYRVKVAVNGSNHKVFINDVQFINATDATYSAAGNFAYLAWDSAAGRFSGHYDNFGVVGYEADFISVSSWTTPALALSGTLFTSCINWNADIPSSSGLVVESTLNNGTLWETCTNGGQIPQLVSGYNAAGKSLKIRYSMTNQSINLPVILHGHSVFVLGAYSASGTRISPALSLSPVGRMGNSLVTWQALLPSGSTTAKVETSPDALAWTDVTASPGGPIPGLLIQPDPTVDGFSTNTSANYTTTFGTGGSAATVTYTTTSSFLTLAGGSKALYLNSAIVVADIDVLADLDMTDSGGLAWRFVDQNNYYTLIVADNQASIGTPSRFTLTKVVGGIPTQLAVAAITFTRSMHHRVRVTMLAGVITASLSGVPIITYTDSSPLGAGKVGFTTNGGTLRSSQLWIAPQGDGTAGKNVYSRVTLGSSDPTVLPQMTDLEIVAYDANIGAGVTIPSADYRYTMIDRNLDDLAKQSNYAWFIDPNLLLHSGNRAAVPAPWILQSNGIGMLSSLEADSNLAVEVLGDLYRNRQVITNVTNTLVFGNNFVGDGQRSSFTLDYPIAPGTAPVITLDGQAQTVGKKGTTGSQWYYADGDATIAQDSSGAILIVSNTLAVSATGTFTDTVIVNNTAAQAALAIRAGNSGIVEAVEDATTNHPGGLLYPAAVTYATQLLTRYCVVDTSNLPTGRTLTFKTYRNGLAVGQVQPVFVPEENLNDAQLLITGIDVGMQTQPGNTVLYNYVVTASELPAIGSWAKLLASGLFG